MGKIKLAITGVGNCADSLAQGIEYYKHVDAKDCIGLMHYEINGYRPGDIEVVAAFDVDKRKVGKDLNEAVFAEPNCTAVFYRVPYCAVEVKMGPVLDGVAPHIYGQISTGLGDYHQEVLTLLKKSRIKKIEYVPGRISEEEKIKMIKEAGVVVYPSHSIQELTQQLIKAMSLSPEDKALQREKASRWVATFT